MLPTSSVIDLTHPLGPNTPVHYEDDAPPGFYTTLRLDGSTPVTLPSHTGTHVDLPPGFLLPGQTLDDLGPAPFLGSGFLLDVRRQTVISEELLKSHAARLERTDFLLLYTGWDTFWGGPDYLKGYPTLSIQAAHYLCSLTLKGVGVDAISVDTSRANDRVHTIFWERGYLLIENLKNLHLLGGSETSFTFSCLPVPVSAKDGAPVRAMAMIDTGW